MARPGESYVGFCSSMRLKDTKIALKILVLKIDHVFREFPSVTRLLLLHVNMEKEKKFKGHVYQQSYYLKINLLHLHE